ncbi:MAG: 4'-phosphopantetheinyl transferase superfamily protein [Desulfuromonadales bacterium]|nr:4'-phosphopantetheinyl transferase superfamily protein [Desulfuromonadales bacterium]
MTLWPPLLTTPSLPPGELHLWRIPLTTSSEEISLLHTLLSTDELQRVDRLLDRRKAQDFIVGRGRLRQILGFYLDADPAAIALTCGRHGKPMLTSNALQFNLSHSGAWAVLALRADAAIGVDLERIDPALDYAALAARFFTVPENALLLAAPMAQRRRRFYRLWTRKEALLKGQGQGFSGAAKGAEGDWQCQAFWLGPGYVGSVASAGEIQTLRRWQVAEDK